jgi:superfamily II DNA/RNA helicase
MPGRLLDVLSAQQKSKQDWLLQEISLLILGEADKMLQLGFAAQVSQVLQNLRPDRQSLLTSATLGSRLERHCQEWMHTPTRISIGRTRQLSHNF